MRRELVNEMVTSYQTSQRQVCAAFGWARSTSLQLISHSNIEAAYLLNNITLLDCVMSSNDVYLAMKFIETSVFTKKLKNLLFDESYRILQNELIKDPGKGRVIRGSGGLRKIRWILAGKGKSGGVRIIYYWLKANDIIIMLSIYSKNEQDDLSSDQLKILKTLVEKEFK